MIKEILNDLPKHQRNQLMCAFEQNIEQFIELKDDFILGVNMSDKDWLTILERAGAFTYGERKK